jgi:hypothetical protein
MACVRNLNLNLNLGVITSFFLTVEVGGLDVIICGHFFSSERG